MEFINSSIANLIIYFMYKGAVNKDTKEMSENIDWIIKGTYNKMLYTNCVGKELKISKAERNFLGYKIYFKVPIGLSIEKMKGLQEVLDKHNPDYYHFLSINVKRKRKNFNNNYLLINVIKKDKLHQYIK